MHVGGWRMPASSGAAAVAGDAEALHIANFSVGSGNLNLARVWRNLHLSPFDSWFLSADQERPHPTIIVSIPHHDTFH